MIVTDARELGRAVAEWRGESRTQQEFADKLGVSRTVVALFEQGRRLPNPDVLASVRKVCGFRAFEWAPLRGHGPTVVECRCLTHYGAWADAQQHVATRHRWKLVVNVKNVEVYIATNGKKHNAAEFASRRAAKWPGRKFLTGKVFVPVPRSRRTADHSYKEWGTYQFASALAKVAGGTVAPLIHRTTEIRKSSDPDRAFPRPSVGEHRATMAYVGGVPVPASIVLVDDLLTKGSTLAASASLLVEAGWKGVVDAIAVGYAVPPGKHDPEDDHVVTLTWRGTSRAPQQSSPV